MPPPLAFSNYDTDEQQYQVIDFASGEITTIPRTGGNRISRYGEFRQPDDFILQSPNFVMRQVRFVYEREGDQDPNGYTLYALAPSGEQTRIMDGISFPGGVSSSWVYWSPNGVHLYFFAHPDGEKQQYTLYQYNSLEQSIHPLIEGFEAEFRGLTCYNPDEWCLVHKTVNGLLDLYLLDKDSGDLWTITQDVSGGYRAWWQEEQNAFFYSLPLADDQIALRFYDLDSHTDTLISEFKADWLFELIWSPDGRWLAVQTSLDDQSDLFVLNPWQPDPEVIPIEISTTQGHVNFIHWVSVDQLSYYAADDGDGLHQKFYLATLPDGQSQVVHENYDSVNRGFPIDFEWSPDGRWLALSYQGYADVTSSIFIIDTLGEVPPQQIPGDFSDVGIPCIGWYAPEAYVTGQAYLCDMHLGVG
jgi:Tol biopolymer transport system component